MPRISTYLQKHPQVDEGALRTQAAHFEKSPLKDFLLKEIKETLDDYRSTLETCKPEDLLKLQGQCIEARKRFAVIASIKSDC